MFVLLFELLVLFFQLVELPGDRGKLLFQLLRERGAIKPAAGKAPGEGQGAAAAFSRFRVKITGLSPPVCNLPDFWLRSSPAAAGAQQKPCLRRGLGVYLEYKAN